MVAALRRHRGFTLVEVLVALVVMAILAALAWRGLETLLRAREVSAESVDRTMRLATVLAQFQQDLQQLQSDVPVPVLGCDARALRLVRRADEGVRLVVWSLDGTTWQRWTSPVATRAAELQETWLRSQQLLGSEPEHVKVLEGVQGWQVYFYRGGALSNCQSSADLAETPQPPPQPTPPSPQPPGENPQPPNPGTPPRVRELLPGGVRLVLQFEGRTLTRDIAVAPSS